MTEPRNWIIYDVTGKAETFAQALPFQIELHAIDGEVVSPIDDPDKVEPNRAKLMEWLKHSMTDRYVVTYRPSGAMTIWNCNVEDAVLVKLRWGSDTAPTAA